VYAVPTAYFLTPFSAISLVCEGGASQALVQRMGLGKANELRPPLPSLSPPSGQADNDGTTRRALLFGKKLSVQELLPSGFVNGLIDAKGDSDEFRTELFKLLDRQLDGLQLDAVRSSSLPLSGTRVEVSTADTETAPRRSSSPRPSSAPRSRTPSRRASPLPLSSLSPCTSAAADAPRSPSNARSNVREVFAGAERFATGKPQEQFAKLASKQMRHKL